MEQNLDKLLAGVKDKQSFHVPDGYFMQLSSDIQERIEKQSGKQSENEESIRYRLSYLWAAWRWKWAYAFSVLLVMATGIVYMSIPSKTVAAETNIEEYLMNEMSEQELSDEMMAKNNNIDNQEATEDYLFDNATEQSLLESL